jgi:hypothetical protein
VGGVAFYAGADLDVVQQLSNSTNICFNIFVSMIVQHKKENNNKQEKRDSLENKLQYYTNYGLKLYVIQIEVL